MFLKNIVNFKFTMKKIVFLLIPYFFLSSCIFTDSLPTLEDLAEAKNEIEDSFDNISEKSEIVPEELKEGYNELKDLIDEDFGWFASNDTKKEKFKTVQNMESNLESCKSACQDLTDELYDLNEKNQLYFEMLNKNLELQPHDLKRKQSIKIRKVKSKYEMIYINTEFQIGDLNSKVEEFEGIVAYLRGDIAIDLIEGKAFKELQEISEYSEDLVDEINKNIEEGRKIISKL